MRGKEARRLCSVPGCGRKHRSKSYCAPHYEQSRAGKPLADPVLRAGSTLSERVRQYSMPLTESGCIVWTNHLSADGYATTRMGGKLYRVHRLVMEQELDRQLSPREWVDHRCGVRSCVNVDHLRVATSAQNAQHITAASKGASGYRNVYWVPSAGKWVVQIRHAGRYLTFGRYSDKEEAARVAQEERRKLFGEFAGTE